MPKRELTLLSLNINLDSNSNNKDSLYSKVTTADYALEEKDSSFRDNKHVIVESK